MATTAPVGTSRAEPRPGSPAWSAQRAPLGSAFVVRRAASVVRRRVRSAGSASARQFGPGDGQCPGRNALHRWRARCPPDVDRGKGQRSRHFGHGRPICGRRCQHPQQQRRQRSGTLRWGDRPDATRCRTAIGLGSRPNGGVPSSAAYIVAPRENTSAAKSDVAAARHLGGEVGRRSRDHPGRGQRDVAGGVRDAEVGELGGAVIGDQHVAGLDVAVHDADLVGGVQRGREVGADPAHLRGRNRPALAQQPGQAAGRARIA